jgi:hypothetical protein
LPSPADDSPWVEAPLMGERWAVTLLDVFDGTPDVYSLRLHLAVRPPCAGRCWFNDAVHVLDGKTGSTR